MGTVVITKNEPKEKVINYSGGSDIVDFTQVYPEGYFEQGSDDKVRGSLIAHRVGNDMVIRYSSLDGYESYHEGYDPYSADFDTYYDKRIIIKDYYSNGKDAKLQVIINVSGYDTPCITNLVDVAQTYADYRGQEIPTVLQIDGTFTRDYMHGSSGADIIRGEDGNDYINAEAGDDTIYGGSGDDRLRGSEGNDKLYGGTGTNRLEFYSGMSPYGHDKVYSDGGTDVLVFVDNPELSVELNGYDLILKEGELDFESSVTIVDYIKHGDNHSVKYLNNGYDDNGDDILISLQDFLSTKTITITGIKEIYGIPDLPDEIQGSELLNIIESAKTVNVIYGKNDNNRINGTPKNDVIIDGSGNNAINANGGDDIIFAGAGKNNLNGNDGDDTFVITTGTDTVNGGKGSNKIVINKDTNTAETIIMNGGGIDTLSFENAISAGDITLDAVGSNLVLKYGDNNSKITVKDYIKLGDKHSLKYISFAGDSAPTAIGDFIASKPVEIYGQGNIKGTVLADIITGSNGKDTIKAGAGFDKIYGGEGDDTILGEDGDDTIYANAGNDKLTGGKGNDKFVFNSTETGVNTITDADNCDTILVENLSKDSLVFGRSGNNLEIFYDESYSSSNKIIVQNYFTKKAKGLIPAIKGYDGEVTDINYIISGEGKISGTADSEIIKGSSKIDTITALAGNDTIYGAGGNDVIKGGDGNDIIFGGYGDDKLYGDAGNNILFFEPDAGNDTVYMNSKGNDVLLFRIQLPHHFKYEKINNNLVIKYTENDSVTIQNYFSTKNPTIDTIYYGNSTQYDETVLKTLSIKNDILPTVYETSKTSKLLYGNAENNLIYTMTPYDTAYGYGGDDTIYMSSRSGFVYGGSGNDTIYISSQNCYAYGDEGNDTFIISSLNNSTAIHDLIGEMDTVRVLDSKKNINVIFDIKRNGYNTENTSLYLFNNTAAKNLAKGKLPTNGVGIAGHDFIERIETKDGYYITNDTIEALKENIVEWFNLPGHQQYSSAFDVVQSGSKTDIASLAQVYAGIEWMPINQ